MKRIAVGLLLSLLSSSAFAQCSGIASPGSMCGNPTASSGPLTTSTVTSMFDRALCGTNGGIITRTGGVWGCSAMVSTGITTALNINPTAASLVQGFKVTQTSPNTGSVAGEFRFNEVVCTGGIRVTTGGGVAPYDSRVSSCLKVTMDQDTNAGGFQIPLQVRHDHKAATNLWSGSGPSDFVSLAIQSYSNAPDNSAVPGGFGAGFYAINTAMWLDVGSQHVHANAMNGQIIFDGGTTSYVAGLRIERIGAGRGSVSDSAYTVAAHAPGQGWSTLLNISEYGEAQSIITTGDIIKAQQALTVANFASLSNMTVTGDILHFPKARLTGAGVMTLDANSVNAASLPAPASGTMLHVAQADSTSAEIEVDTYGSGVNVYPKFRGARSRGTAAVRSAVQADDVLVAVGGSGYTGSAQSVMVAGMSTHANQTFTGSANGTYLQFFTTPNGSTTPANRLNISAAGVLTSSLNATGITSLPAAGTSAGTSSQVRVVPADDTAATIEIDSFGATVTTIPTLRGIRSRGTAAARTATQLDDVLLNVLGDGYQTTTNAITGSVVGISFFAAQNFTSTANGTYIQFATTTNGASLSTARGAIENDGGLTWPRTVAGGTKGAGSINATTLYQANVQVATLSGSETLSNKTLSNPSVTGTLFSPSVTGGLAAGSTLTLISTGAAGTTDATIFQTGSQVEAGRINTTQQWQIGPNITPGSNVKLQISKNSSTPPAPESDTVVHIIPANTASNRITMDAYGTGVSGTLTYRHARGTVGALTATQSGDPLGATFGKAYDGSNYSVNAGSGFVMVATQNQSSTTKGARLDIYATQDGNNNAGSVAQFDRPSTATQTALSIFDVDNNTIERVTVGAADSCGAGFKCLRIPN